MKYLSEGATETVFKNICSFFPGATFLWFSRRVHLFLEQTWIFQESLSVRRTHTNFPGASILSPIRYSFSRKPYLILKHIQFSRRPLCLEHIGIFQEGTPSRTDISLLGLGGCFRPLCLLSYTCKPIQVHAVYILAVVFIWYSS